uniref:Uncharacterized protein n=1 Tax=Arundo donax TaxID=35708 RepID=A0A0A9G2F2_ARUDO
MQGTKLGTFNQSYELNIHCTCCNSFMSFWTGRSQTWTTNIRTHIYTDTLKSIKNEIESSQLADN